MGLPELDALKAKYRAQETRQALNRAIRAEIEGGAELLDKMQALYFQAKSKTNPDRQNASELLRVMTETRRQMSKQICDKYGIELDPSKW